MTKYTEFLDAVERYYGTGSDQWLEIAQYGVSGDNFLEIVDSLPEYRAVVNGKGEVISYEKFAVDWNTGTGSNTVTDIVSQIDSNTQAGARTAVKEYYPATTTIDTHGEVVASKQISTTSGLEFVSKTVLPAIVAVGTGISLGKTIDSLLYNANPDFWDSHGMGSLDPNTWGSITADLHDSAGEEILGTAFNLLFGINPTTKTGQAYVDQYAFAYMAMYMQEQGVFDGWDEWDGQGATGYDVYQPVGRASAPIFSFTDGDNISHKLAFGLSGLGLWDDTSIHTLYGGIQFTNENPPADIMISCITYDDCLYTSKSRFNVDAVFVWDDGSYLGGSSANLQEFTYDNRTVYYTRHGIITQVLMPNTLKQYTVYNNDNYYLEGIIAWLTQYGNFNTHQISGIGTQTGATLPQLDNGMNIEQILQALRTQYPQLFNQSITNTVAQPDGTVKTITYVPIALPENTGKTDTQPTGDGQTINQTHPEYDPSTDTDGEIWDKIAPTITDPPTEDENGDDTGEGTTPAVVPPTGSASALWTIYNPSQSQLNDFGAWLWSSDFVEQLKKLFNDPMQAIIGLHKVYATPNRGTNDVAIKVGYLTSTANAKKVTSQYVDVDCGTVGCGEYFGNVFDYDPYTKISLYLPFIGIVTLNNSDVMRGKISVKYHIDVLTGSCLAEISVIRDSAGGVLYTYSGNCAVQYPVSSGSYIGIITGLLGIAGGVAGTIATGGALAPMLMGAGASIGSMHANVEHSGSISGNAGAMGIKKPYLIIERPQTKMPNNGFNYEGLPQNKTVTLSSIKGYVRVKKTHYDNIPCTGNELELIRTLLESGVYID